MILLTNGFISEFLVTVTCVTQVFPQFCRQKFIIQEVMIIQIGYWNNNIFVVSSIANKMIGLISLPLLEHTYKILYKCEMLSLIVNA
jgi:hypothetical protein